MINEENFPKKVIMSISFQKKINKKVTLTAFIYFFIGNSIGLQ